MTHERLSRMSTLIGFGDGAEMERIADDLPMSDHPRGQPVSFPEVEIVAERGGPDLIKSAWSAYMIWTQRRIYCVDSGLVCCAVLDRASFMPVTEHPVMGCRLAFGQRRDASGTIVQVTHPLPEEGTNAVFSAQVGQRVRWSETSPVTRVVLRQHRVDLVIQDRRSSIP
jgi:hypothetical protein